MLHTDSMLNVNKFYSLLLGLLPRPIQSNAEVFRMNHKQCLEDIELDAIRAHYHRDIILIAHGETVI